MTCDECDGECDNVVVVVDDDDDDDDDEVADVDVAAHGSSLSLVSSSSSVYSTVSLVFVTCVSFCIYHHHRIIAI